MRVIDELRKENRSLNNRIQSIIVDSEFVEYVKKIYELPLVANMRCGLWYVPTKKCDEVSYFKSTDGHAGCYDFSLKRLNLHVLDLVENSGGVIIVDSTRRGKVMPDALSKTIPIWCTVLNAVIFGDATFHSPINVVSESERAQISSKVQQWVANVQRLGIRPKLRKPLRPIWVNPDSCLPLSKPSFEQFYPVVLCMASRRAQDGELCYGNFTYVQGAGDDHEAWAGPLTPELLWKHAELRISADDIVIRERLAQLNVNVGSKTECVRFNDFISFTTNPFSSIHLIDLRPGARWSLHAGKRGARELARHLDEIVQFYEEAGPHIQICSTEIDDAVLGIVLVLECLFFSEDGVPCTLRQDKVSKDEVLKRLVPIVGAAHRVPSRTMLNIIGSFLRRS